MDEFESQIAVHPWSCCLAMSEAAAADPALLPECGGGCITPIIPPPPFIVLDPSLFLIPSSLSSPQSPPSHDISPHSSFEFLALHNPLIKHRCREEVGGRHGRNREGARAGLFEKGRFRSTASSLISWDLIFGWEAEKIKFLLSLL